MERKVIKRLAMLSLVAVFTLCAAVVSANAQLSNPIRAKITFDFSVGDKKLVLIVKLGCTPVGAKMDLNHMALAAAT